MCGLAGHQIVVPGTRSNSTSRARVVLQMPCSSDKRDADGDALFDRQHDDRGGGGHDQQEFAERLAIDRDDLLDADDPQRHEQQHAAERRIRDVLQQRGAERQQRQHDGRGEQPGQLRFVRRSPTRCRSAAGWH